MMMKLNDKQVTNPVVWALCSVALGCGMVLLPFMIFAAALAHPFLWAAGRKGTMQANGTGISVIFNKTSFERR